MKRLRRYALQHIDGNNGYHHPIDGVGPRICRSYQMNRQARVASVDYDTRTS
jgi:hypothetical protein